MAGGRILSGAASACLVTFCCAFPAHAQLGVSPLVVEEQAERGRAQGVVTLFNVTDQPIRVRLYSEPFTYDKDGFVGLTEDPMDLSPYLQFSPREAVIPPMGNQRVRMLSLFPPGLDEGEYRSIVFAEELTDRNIDEGNAALQVRIGSTVYVHQGELFPSLSVLSAQVQNESNIELLVSNQGDATARVDLSWQLNQSDNVLAEGTGSSSTVIAKGERFFSLELPTAIADGSYTLTGELRWISDERVHTQPFSVTVSALVSAFTPER